MARPCKNKEDVLNRMKAMYRLGRMKDFVPGLFSPELFGSKTKKTGELSIDDIVKGLAQPEFLITECRLTNRITPYELPRNEEVEMTIRLIGSGNTSNIPNVRLIAAVMEKLEYIK